MNRKLTGLRPSPAIVVAVMALVAAVAGTAVAGPGASTSKITKKKVTKIATKVANQEIDKRAPGLSVAHANTATSATTATNATNASHANTATSAETAANAEALSGNTVVGEGDLDGPGGLGISGCTSVSEPVPGAQPGDHVVLTPPSGWPTYEVNLTARVTADTVTYEICNQSGAFANFGTGPPLRFLVFR